MAVKLPLVLAGPIVRRASEDAIWFWLACSQEIKGCEASIVPLQQNGQVWSHLVDPDVKAIVLCVSDQWTMRIGERIWIVIASAVPKSGKFPTDIILGYDLVLSTEEDGAVKATKLSSLGLNIHYEPFTLPTLVIGKLNSRLAHGSCRRPGAEGEDAHNVFDEHLAKTAPDAFGRPSSLILTGDQIYADDVAVPLFVALHKIAAEVFGYVERIPKEDGSGLTTVDNYSWQNVPPPEPGTGAGSRSGAPPAPIDLFSGRRRLTHRLTSPIGFSTEDGEAHLLSFPEYCSMYLVVWGPDLCKTFGVDDGKVRQLKNFAHAVGSSRRVMANIATYMVFDDHDVTDDWNLDKPWEEKTKANPMARRILGNALAAYWAFQGWGNDPDMFDDAFRDTLAKHVERLRKAKGVPDTTAARFEDLLLDATWTFMAACNPKALCVDIRTRRETPRGKCAVLSGKRVQPFMSAQLKKHGFPKGGLLFLVLPTPFFPHRSLMKGQEHEYEWPANKYEGDFEFYGNNPEQRGELIYWLKQNFDPAAVVIFSGDVHHGSVLTGRYAYGSDLEEMKAGKSDWVIRVVQVTSSPIKNIKGDVYLRKRWYLAGTDAGNFGESVVRQWEHQYATVAKDRFIAMQAAARHLKGPLGRQTFVFENHFCVVDMPDKPGEFVRVLFIGAKGGKLKTAEVTVDTDNDPAKFKFIKPPTGVDILLPPLD